jgi:hypothetical protein
MRRRMAGGASRQSLPTLLIYQEDPRFPRNDNVAVTIFPQKDFICGG